MFSPRHLVAGAVMASSIAMPLATNAQTVTHTPVRHPIVHVTKKTVTPRPITKKPLTKPNPATDHEMMNTFGKNSVNGTIASINGTTLSVTGSNKTTYTVDASQAKLSEGMTTSLTLSSVQVGDKISANGTLTGTNLVAKMIRDNSFEGRNIFSGSVSAINGSSITLTGHNKTTVTIDASQATITKPQRPTSATATPTTTALTLTDIKTGDRLTAFGALNGTTVSATQISDMGQFARGTMGARGMGR